MRVIFYDSIITGHHLEYLGHILKSKEIQNNNVEYYFVVPEKIKENGFELVNSTNNMKHINWVFLENEKVELLYSNKLWKRSFKEYKIVKEIATKVNADIVFLMYFNVFQLALVFARPKFNVQGILFGQFYRIQRDSLKKKLKYLIKSLNIKLLLINKNIKSIYILNDKFTVDTVNLQLSKNIFKYLPDPIPQFSLENGFDIYKHYGISIESKILLHAGSIDDRKGTFELIKSIDFINSNSCNNYSIVIVGKISDTFHEKLLKIKSQLKRQDFKIIIDNSFVSNERLASLFHQSFAVLLPYKNPEASSGILGHAINHKKYVLAPKQGLIGEMVFKNKLGIVINNIFPKDIAKGIEQLQKLKPDNDNFEKFIQDHSVNKFSELILKF